MLTLLLIHVTRGKTEPISFNDFPWGCKISFEWPSGQLKWTLSHIINDLIPFWMVWVNKQKQNKKQIQHRMSVTSTVGLVVEWNIILLCYFGFWGSMSIFLWQYCKIKKETWHVFTIKQVSIPENQSGV